MPNTPNVSVALLSAKGNCFVSSLDNRPLAANEVLSHIGEHDGNYCGITIWESYWDCSFAYRLDKVNSKKICLELKLQNKGSTVSIDFPKDLTVDYIIHESNFLPLRPSDAIMLKELATKVFVDEDPTLSVIELLALEYHAAEHQIQLANTDLRTSFFAGHSSQATENLSGLTVKPYPYQEVGIDWLKSQQILGKSGVLLCDVMGLGKTLQAIGFLLGNLKNGLKQNLIVCPSTLIENWRREFAKFAPEVNVYLHTGPRRTGVVRGLIGREVVITSYDTLISDASILQSVAWNVVLIDEAQAIKNPNAKRTVRVKALPRNFSVAVTGTPLENKLMDLWSLVDFANPRLLGEKTEFERGFSDDVESAQLLGNLIKPVMLRRNLYEVENQLPEKTIIDHPLVWPEALVDVYESVRKEAWQQYPAAGGLVATSRLRQLATHPRLLGIGPSNLSELSPKFALTVSLLEELFENGEKALIFTSYSDMVDSFVLDFSERFPAAFVRNLDGRVLIEKRQDLVEEFNGFEGPGVLVCNPIVAGAGLNITGANHVIHYNLEWNPAKEDQATFRVFRNGQTKHTFVHRFFYVDTIDEVIDQRMTRKRKLSDLSVDAHSEKEDFESAMSISPKGGGQR